MHSCDALGDAINALTETEEIGEATLRMPTKDHQDSIEHLCGYMSRLNRGKGMGFFIMRKRITHSFVILIMAQAVSAMAFLIPIIKSIYSATGQLPNSELRDGSCAC